MPACPTMISPVCVLSDGLISTAASGATDGVMGEIAQSVRDGIAWIVANSTAWWVKVPSPNLADEAAIDRLQQWTMPIAAAVAVLGVIIAGGKMALTRKAYPLVDVGSGLLILACTSAIGVLTASMLVKAGDAWSKWVLNASADGQFGLRLTQALQLTEDSSVLVIVLGVIAILLGAIQAVLMLFREAALVVLAGVLPLAASGAFTTLTRPWFRKVTGWMLALIFYKPAAAAVYATTFTMLGRTRDPRTFLMALTMMLLSLIALPVLIRFFTWTTGSLESQSHGGVLGAAVTGAVAVGAFWGSGSNSRSTGVSSHAGYIATQLNGGHVSRAGQGGQQSTSARSSLPSALSGGSSSTGGTAAASRGGAAASGAAAGAAGAAGAAAVTVVSGLATGARNAADRATAPTSSSRG